jgi:hypothetical protein
MLNEDYKDMLQCLLEEKVRFLLVGAYAVAVYGYPRATKDMDVFVRAASDNASNLLRALRRFGALYLTYRKSISQSKESFSRLATALGELTSSHASAVLALKKPMPTRQTFRSRVCKCRLFPSRI